jgi:HSP20 family protein
MEVFVMFSLVPFSRKNTGLTRRGDFWGIDRFFDDFFNNSFFGIWSNSLVKADVRETENEWIIDAEIPGVDKEDIQVDLNDGYLTISVEQNNEVNEENENYIRRERAYGSYKRCFYVDDVKEDEIKATYKNGVLSLTVPKTKPTKKQGIKIDIQ